MNILHLDNDVLGIVCSFLNKIDTNCFLKYTTKNLYTRGLKYDVYNSSYYASKNQLLFLKDYIHYQPTTDEIINLMNFLPDINTLSKFIHKYNFTYDMFYAIILCENEYDDTYTLTMIKWFQENFGKYIMNPFIEDDFLDKNKEYLRERVTLFRKIKNHLSMYEDIENDKEFFKMVIEGEGIELINQVFISSALKTRKMDVWYYLKDFYKYNGIHYALDIPAFEYYVKKFQTEERNGRETIMGIHGGIKNTIELAVEKNDLTFLKYIYNKCLVDPIYQGYYNYWFNELKKIECNDKTKQWIDSLPDAIFNY